VESWALVIGVAALSDVSIAVGDSVSVVIVEVVSDWKEVEDVVSD
jgi:hypothetical protein